MNDILDAILIFLTVISVIYTVILIAQYHAVLTLGKGATASTAWRVVALGFPAVLITTLVLTR